MKVLIEKHLDTDRLAERALNDIFEMVCDELEIEEDEIPNTEFLSIVFDIAAYFEHLTENTIR